MSKQKMGLIAMAIMAAGVFAWVVMTQGPLAAVKVTVDKVKTGNLSSAVFGIGTIEARRSYNLAPTMTSRINKVLVDQGDHVTAGQVLAEMDPLDLDDKVVSSQQVAERAANTVRIADAQLLEAKSRARNVSATFNRFTELRARGFVSQESLDAKQHEKDAALAGVDAATAASEAARHDQAKARADAIGVGKLLRQTRLISPVDGIISARLLEHGATAVPGQTIIQVIDPTSLWVKTRIDQKQAGQIRVGQDAEIVLRSQPQTAVPGKVERVDLTSDAVTEERIVNVAFATPRDQTGIGEYGEVTIKLPAMDNVRSVPSAAMKHFEQRDGVWTLQDGRTKFKPVITGVATLDGRTQIVEGLSDGDEVIVYSQQPMRTDLKVKVVAEIPRGNP